MVAPALAFAGGVAVGAAVAAHALRRRLARRRPRRVLVGLEVAASQSWRILRGSSSENIEAKKKTKTRVGVFTNHTGVCPRTGRHVVDMLHACTSVDLRAVFAPEHGFRGEKQAGFSSGGGASLDAATGVKIVDAYRSRGDPAALALMLEDADVDCVVFDVQDVGARFYTYVSSLYDLLVAVARLNNETSFLAAKDSNKKKRRKVSVVVLDRPNPLGGLTTEGPVVVEKGFESFVSRVSVPIRHGMTVGELALLFNRRFVGADPKNPSGKNLAKSELRVAPMRRWRRSMAWEDTKLPWVPPSPNVPSPTSALAYVGTCLLEATNACEGRGTTTPFELIGAPWADNRLACEMNRRSATRAPAPFSSSSSSRKNNLNNRRRRLTAPVVDARLQRPASACVWREAHFTPLWGKEKDVPCVGASAMFLSSEVEDDKNNARVRNENLPPSVARVAFVKRALFLEGVELILALKKLYPRAFQWREGPVAYIGTRKGAGESVSSLSRVERANQRARVLASPTKFSRNNTSSSPPFIDLLTGSAGFRLAIDGVSDPESRRVAVEREREKWEKQLVAFEKSRRDALLY